MNQTSLDMVAHGYTWIRTTFLSLMQLLLHIQENMFT